MRSIFLFSGTHHGVIRNGDAHLKNFSILYDESNTNSEEPDIWLSPTFDLCTSNTYISNDMLALTLDDSKQVLTH